MIRLGSGVTFSGTSMTAMLIVAVDDRGGSPWSLTSTIRLKEVELSSRTAALYEFLLCVHEL